MCPRASDAEGLQRSFHRIWTAVVQPESALQLRLPGSLSRTAPAAFLLAVLFPGCGYLLAFLPHSVLFIPLVG